MHLHNDLRASLVKGPITVRVRPRAKVTKVQSSDETSSIYQFALRAPPEKGAANRELVKYVSKLVGKPVRITRGLKSRTKVLQLVR
jgi:uncharacterized protein (TIGR00251 family)